jgi:hypothetical protein
MFFGFSSAQDQPKWRFFSGLLLVLLQPSEVQFHLSLVRCSELTQLQVYSEQPSQAPMVEQ